MVSIIVLRKIPWYLSHYRTLHWCPRYYTLEHLYILSSWLVNYVSYSHLIIVRSSIKSISIGRHIMVLTIFALYILTTVIIGNDWAHTQHAFINEGQNCLTIFLKLFDISPAKKQEILINGITSCISTFIVDISLVGNKRPLSYMIANHYFNPHLLDLALLDCVEPSVACCYCSSTLYYSRHR